MKLVWMFFSLTILNPRLTKPYFLFPNQVFDIYVLSSDTPQVTSGFIKNLFDSVNIQIINVQNVSQDTWNLEAQFFSFPEEGIYDLVIDLNSVRIFQKNAVVVVDSFKKNVRILQMSDIHIGASGTSENYKKAIELSNFLNPDIVIHTGDIGEIHDSSYYFEYMDLTSGFHNPVFTVPGNHDYYYILGFPDTCLIYQNIVNPYVNFYVEYGDYLFIFLNTGRDSIVGNFASRCYGLTQEQIAWLESVLRNNFSKKVKIVSMHGPYFSQQNSGIYNSVNRYGKFEFLNLCSSFEVNMVLTGHTHLNEIFDRNGNLQAGKIKPLDGTIYATVATTTKDIPESCSVRFIEIKNGLIERYTVDRDGDGKREGSSSIHLTDFEFIYHFPNNGTSDYQYVEIYNNIYEKFYDLRLYLKMLPGYFYNCNGGTILRQKDGFVEVKIDSINSLGSLYVEIYHTGTKYAHRDKYVTFRGEKRGYVFDISGRKIKLIENKGIFFLRRNNVMRKVLKLK